MKTIIYLLAATTLLTGCESVVKYPPSANWDSTVHVLGPIKADSGFWPLSLRHTPPQYTFTSALQNKAATQYNVPASSVVLGEMSVSIGSEMDGTIRDWTAQALAGQITNLVPHQP